MDISIFKDKKIYCVVDSDLDGVTSRIVAEYYLIPLAKTFVLLNTADREMSEFTMKDAEAAEIVIFVDIAPTLELYEKLTIELQKIVYIFDHHATSRELLGERENYYYDDTRCGAKILFEELSEGIRPNRTLAGLVNLANTYDTWQLTSPFWEEAKSLHYVLFSSLYINWNICKTQSDTEKHQKFVNAQFTKIMRNCQFFFTALERKAAESARIKEEASYKKAKDNLSLRIDNCETSYAFVEIGSKISIVMSRLLDHLGDSVKYLIGYSTWDRTNSKVSLRSRGEFDVSKIAQIHGGGGHKNASAVELKPLMLAQLRQGKIHLA
jgi:hypothetical protein